MSIIHLALKDLLQMMRDRKTIMFLLIMPIGFTLVFGYAFSGTNAPSDPRLPVGFLDQDGSDLALQLKGLLDGSQVIRLAADPAKSPADLEKSLLNGDLAGVLIVPQGYGQALQAGEPLKLTFWTDTSKEAGQTTQNEVAAAAYRLSSAVRSAQIVSQATGADSDTLLASALDAWQKSPVQLKTTLASSIPLPKPQTANPMGSMSHSAPAMMLQFAIAGLLTCATIIVNERKNRCMQRLLTTATSRWQIMLGHFLAIFLLLLAQFATLIVFGQLVLRLDYARQPLATGLMAVTTVACIAAMGLLIGALSKTDEQAIIFSLIPMFILSGLGGAWVPLEVAGQTFQMVGHFSPVAWAMDGFKGILLRGLDLSGVLLPSAAMLGYALVFFVLAVWRFKFE